MVETRSTLTGRDDAATLNIGDNPPAIGLDQRDVRWGAAVERDERLRDGHDVRAGSDVERPRGADARFRQLEAPQGTVSIERPAAVERDPRPLRVIARERQRSFHDAGQVLGWVDALARPVDRPVLDVVGKRVDRSLGRLPDAPRGHHD